MLEVVMPAIRDVVQRKHGIFRSGIANVRLSMDRASWHSAALRQGLLLEMGLAQEQLLPHPACSPDFQAPVEWSHDWLKDALKKHLRAHPRKHSDAAICDAIQRLFHGRELVGRQKVITAERVLDAFSRVQRNFSAVIAHGGSYGMKRST
jgi:hypothetical protein